MSKHNHVNPARTEGNNSAMKKNLPENEEKKQETPQENIENKEEKPASETEETKTGDSDSKNLSPEQKIADLEAKLADMNDQFLRKAADFENFRKRTVREKQELVDFANQNLLLDLLPVIDDFERAIKSGETSDFQSVKDFHSFYEGVTLIEKRLSTQLENKWGLKRFDSAGEHFDPTRHEAIQMEKADGITEAVVKDDFLKGYLLKDRVIRFAKVKVLMPKNEEAKNGEEQGTCK